MLQCHFFHNLILRKKGKTYSECTYCLVISLESVKGPSSTGPKYNGWFMLVYEGNSSFPFPQKEKMMKFFVHRPRNKYTRTHARATITKHKHVRKQFGKEKKNRHRSRQTNRQRKRNAEEQWENKLWRIHSQEHSRERSSSASQHANKQVSDLVNYSVHCRGNRHTEFEVNDFFSEDNPIWRLATGVQRKFVDKSVSWIFTWQRK